MNYIKLSPRESDQKVFIADITKIKNMIGWKPNVSKEEGIKELMKWIERNLQKN